MEHHKAIREMKLIIYWEGSEVKSLSLARFLPPHGL